MGNNSADPGTVTGNSPETIDRGWMQAEFADPAESDDIADSDLVVVDADEDGVTVALDSELEEALPEWEDASPEEIAAVADTADVDAFDLEGVGDADPGDRVVEVGGGDLSEAFEAIDYEDVVEDQTGRDSQSFVPDRVQQELARLETETIGDTDVTRLEALIADVDEYDSVEDVIRDVRRSWHEPDYETAFHREQMNRETHSNLFGERFGKLNGDLSDVDRVVFSDSSDMDGQMSMALYDEAHGDDTLVVPAGNKVDERFEEVLQEVPEGTTVTVVDLNPREDENWMNAISQHADGNPIEVRDHHEWSNDAMKRVLANNLSEGYSKEEVKDMVEIDTSAEAAARLVYEKDISGSDLTSTHDGVSNEEYRENIRDAVEVTEAADTQNHDHERWDDAKYMRSYAYERTYSEFREMASRHGSDFLSETEEGRTFAEVSLINDMTSAVGLGETASQTTVEAGGDEYEVATLYAGGGDENAMAKKLENRGADLVAIGTPSLYTDDSGDLNATLSLRAPDDGLDCVSVGEHIDGNVGGRAQAAGMGDIPADDLFEGATGFYDARSEHRDTAGRKVRSRISEQLPDAVRNAVEDSEE